MPSSQMITFNTTSSTWGSVQVSGGELNSGHRDGGLFATSDQTTEGTGYYAGGGQDRYPGLVSFDSKTVSWTNQTADESISASFRGQMLFTRFGQNGSLIVIGGFNQDFNTSSPDNGTFFALRPMTDIGVYDIASGTWSNVTASGEIPDRRANYCSAVSAAPDYSR